MPNPLQRVLLISVGGSAEPIATSINVHQPDYVVFFTSLASRAEIESKVRPLTSHRWIDQQIITTPDPQDLTVCLEVLTDKLHACLTELGLSQPLLIVDYTGGTKTMSAALVLATINSPVEYSYVGGTVRDKNGVGIVTTGSETIVKRPNPWDVLAVEPRRKLARQFNNGQFIEARDTAIEAAQKVGERWRVFFVAARDLCEGYAKWFTFDYAGAIGPLKSAVGKLQQYTLAANDRPLAEFVQGVNSECAFLKPIAETMPSIQSGATPHPDILNALVDDLVRNALVALRIVKRPDDATVRLYSACEKLAKSRLLEYGIDNSAAPPERLPETLREDYCRRYGDAETPHLQFGLRASYVLLAELGDPLGARFKAREKELTAILEVRNASLMIHGWSPIKHDTSEKLLAILLDFLDRRESDVRPLPHFPER